MKRRIYIDKVYGRLGNHLYRWSHLIAFAQAYDVEVWDLSRNVKQSFLLFPQLRKKLLPVLNLPTKFWHVPLARWRSSLAKCMHGWVHFRCVKRIQNEAKPYSLTLDNLFPNGETEVIIDGFNFHVMDALLMKYTDYLRGLFQPYGTVQDAAHAVLRSLRENAECIVAVHVRRGDYEECQDGRYFYDLPYYRQQMLKLDNLLTDWSVHFIVFSDDRGLDISAFNGFSCLRAKFTYSQDFDWYLISQADYIIGPPSTYSGWASFFGNTPMYQLEPNSDLPTSLEDYRVVQSLTALPKIY